MTVNLKLGNVMRKMKCFSRGKKCLKSIFTKGIELKTFRTPSVFVYSFVAGSGCLLGSYGARSFARPIPGLSLSVAQWLEISNHGFDSYRRFGSFL